MKKNMTCEEMLKELEEKKQRVEVFQNLLQYIDDQIHWKCDRIEVEAGYYEPYIDEDGNEKKRYHCPVYKVDENGDDVRIPPEEGSYYYKEYVAWCKVRDEIVALI